jgi:hypothetical protein
MLDVKIVTCSLGWKKGGGLRSVTAELLSSWYREIIVGFMFPYYEPTEGPISVTH